MLIMRMALLFSVFTLMTTLVSAIPSLLKLYRDRFQVSQGRTTRELTKFFLNVKPTRILIGACAVGILLGFVTGSWVVTAALCLAGVFAPKVLLRLWKDIRTSQFEAQLMDALLLLGNTLKSGLDLIAGVERIASTMKPPISEEFGLVLNAYRLGTPLESALADLTERIHSRALEIAIQAINIQRETGGNIIKTFDQLVFTIREEGKLQKKIRAITAQGRTQIVFLAVFPWALALLFFCIAPEFMRPALANTWGQLTALGLILWEVVGIIVTKRIITVDV